METATYVLYTNKSYTNPKELCPGSKECVRLAAARPDVLVQDVDAIVQSGVALPAWLDGTPTVVDMAKSAASKGAAAVKLLQSLGNGPGGHGGVGGVGGHGVPPPRAVAAYNDDKLTAADTEAIVKERIAQAEAPVQNRAAPTPISDA